MSRWVVIILQALTLQYVVSGPVHDCIFAYIPIEEFERLMNMGTYPITSYQLVFPDGYETGPTIIIDETTYYAGPFNSMRGIPIFLNQGFPVYSVSAPLSVYQHVSVPSISVLPSVSLPTISVSTPSGFPTTSISFPGLPSTYVKYDEVYEDAAVEEVVELPEEDSVPVAAATAPISGTMCFNGMVPVSGKINIYANF